MFKKLFSLAFILAALSLCMLTACSDESETCERCVDENGDGICDACSAEIPDPSLDGKIAYTVRVVDAMGAPVPNMIVSLFNGEDVLAVKITGNDGTVSCSEANAIEAADAPFTVSLTDPKNSDFYYDTSLAVISDGKEDITITIYEKTTSRQSETLYLNDGPVDSVNAPILDDGGYHVTLAEGTNYFVFVPTRRGQYRISASSDAELTVGYYGSPHFVQSFDLASTDGSGEVFKNDDGLFFNIRIFNVGEDYYSSSRYVFRIDATAAGSAVVKVECVDTNLPMSKEELPWEQYILAKDPEKYVHQASDNTERVDFDITSADLSVVYNESDGFYHLGTVDGPVILVKLTVDSPYIASIKTIMETTQLAVYIYGDDGELDRKVDYHSMMQKYVDAADETLGIYPLTPAIKEAFIAIGDAWGWYGSGSNSILPIGTIYENAYLFACCYYVEK